MDITAAKEDVGGDVVEDRSPALGPGRPRKIHTEKPGRPAEQYHMKKPTPLQKQSTVEVNFSFNEENRAVDRDWCGVQLVMAASEIPFLRLFQMAMSGKTLCTLRSNLL